MRLAVASVKAPCGPPLRETDLVEVTLTVDAGADDLRCSAVKDDWCCARGGFCGWWRRRWSKGGVDRGGSFGLESLP
jgi:hypothetical protein